MRKSVPYFHDGTVEEVDVVPVEEEDAEFKERTSRVTTAEKLDMDGRPSVPYFHDGGVTEVEIVPVEVEDKGTIAEPTAVPVKVAPAPAVDPVPHPKLGTPKTSKETRADRDQKDAVRKNSKNVEQKDAVRNNSKTAKKENLDFSEGLPPIPQEDSFNNNQDQVEKSEITAGEQTFEENTEKSEGEATPSRSKKSKKKQAGS